MSKLTKITSAMLASGLSTLLFMSPALAATNNDTSPVTNGVSQKIDTDKAANEATAESLNKLLPTIDYTTEGLSQSAKKINTINWKEGTKIDRKVGTRLQALLNWHHNGVGPVDGLKQNQD